ncbi:hypothetical protein EXIGLDRAFT_846478 [Exidia glandulosa HHB12029]|uniref:Uncharacterized protein n=1 Tax=Exidia glandulosa HHB12029 TaxID=1314781 RepID=A0A165AWW3_EXIGL|nr:hypothetical protein EXIGLDRAFT_846478 [Exidia glandulosa HHB12029]
MSGTSTLRQRVRATFARSEDADDTSDGLRVIPFSQSPFNVSLPKDELDDVEKPTPAASLQQQTSNTSHYAQAFRDQQLFPSETGSFPPGYQQPSRFTLPIPMPFVHAMEHLGNLDTRDAGVKSALSVGSSSSGVPMWLGVFFELSWTTTFSNLTANTRLTTFHTLLSYAVFFLLSWWLWASQVSYDTKFYSNDWYHRIQLLLQLTIFGTLSAFTMDFDPFRQYNERNSVDAQDYTDNLYVRKTNLAISGLFAAARLLLIISYCRVLYYLPSESKNFRQERKHLISKIGTYATSCVLFILALLVTVSNPSGEVGGRVFLWMLAIAIEATVYLVIPGVDGDSLVNADSLAERVDTLTTIILGEGLNSIAGTLVLAASAVGFGSKTGYSAASISLIICVGFLLYFDGLRRKTLSTSNRSRLNILLHFPLHLALIVLLESLNNHLVYSAISAESIRFADAVRPKTNQTAMQTYQRALRDVGVDFNLLLMLSNSTGVVSAVEFGNKATAQVVLNLYNQYQIITDEIQDTLTAYIFTSGGDALTDLPGSPSYAALVSARISDIQASDVFIPVAAGAYLIFLAIIAIVNAWIPQNRYIWASALCRFSMGVVVALIALARLTPSSWQHLLDAELLPLIVAIAFIVQFALDQVIVYMAFRGRWTSPLQDPNSH